MNNLSVKFFTMTALLCGIFFLANCGGGATNTATTNKPADAPKNDAPKTDAPKTDAPKTETTSGDSVGVPECDEYIKKYEACVNSKVPEAQRGAFKSSFETMRKSWKDAAANPQGKAALATGCKQALDQAKQTFSSYSCEW